MSWKDQLDEGKRIYDEGKYPVAKEKLSKALKGAESDSTAPEECLAQIRYHLGRTYSALSEFDEAEKLQLEARAFFADKKDYVKDYAMCLKALGDQYQVIGANEKAHSHLDEALEKIETITKDKLQERGEIFNSFGLLYWRKGDSDKSIEYYEKALEQYGDTIGDSHEYYGETIDNIGVCYQQKAEYDKAVDFHRRGLKIREDSVGPEHPDVSFSLSNLAVAQAFLGDDSEYESLLTRAIEITEISMGKYNQHSGVITGNLGTHYIGQMNYKKALEQYSKALEINEHIYGADSYKLATSVHNMGVVTSLMGDQKEAKKYRERSIILNKKRLEEEGGKNINTIINLADSLSSNGHKEEAEELIKRSIHKIRKDEGRFNPKLLRLYELLSSLQISITGDDSNYELSREYLIEMLKIQKKIYGNRHPNISKTLKSLSDCHQMQGDDTTGQILQWQAKAIEFEHGISSKEDQYHVNMLKQKIDDDDVDEKTKSGAMKSLISVLRMQGNSEEADKIEEEYEKEVEERLGADSLEYAEHLLMGSLSLMNPEKNFDTLERVLEIQENHPDVQYDDLIGTFNHMMLPLASMKDWQKTEKYMTRVIEIAKEQFGCDHWTTRAFFTMLIDALKEQDKQTQAKEYQDRLDAITEPTKEEEEEQNRKVQEKLEKSLESLMGGLGGMFDGLSQFMPQEGEDELETDENMSDAISDITNLMGSLAGLNPENIAGDDLGDLEDLLKGDPDES